MLNLKFSIILVIVLQVPDLSKSLEHKITPVNKTEPDTIVPENNQSNNTNSEELENGLRCIDGNYVSIENVCDSGFYNLTSAQGKVKGIMRSPGMNCFLGDDEVGCQQMPCSLRPNPCSQTCLDLPNNTSKCTCYPGYKLTVKFKLFQLTHLNITEKCEDINECEMSDHKCRHGCQNLNGTYKCFCRDGYTMDPFDHFGTCKAEDNKIHILYNSGSWIHSYNLESKKIQQIVPSGRLDYMDYDLHTDIIYWWNKHNHKIQRSFLTGAKDNKVSVGLAQNMDNNILMDNVQRYSLQVDWMGGNLYWLSKNTLNKTLYNIMASTLDGRYIKTISTVTQASSLVLDPENGVMYWISKEKEHHTKINSAWMNGWSHKTVHDFKKEMHPLILALDISSFDTRIFWWDSISNYIFSSNSDGSSVRKVVSTNLALRPLTMDIFEEYIYWVTNHSQLVRHNKYGTGDTDILIKNLIHQSSIKIHHKNKISRDFIENYRSRCDKNCEYLCIITPVGYICACPDGSDHQTSSYSQCGVPLKDKLPDPLICDCSNTEQICNISSVYSMCDCKAKCQHFHRNDINHEFNEYNRKYNSVEILLGILLTISVLICFILSFYKRSTTSLI